MLALMAALTVGQSSAPAQQARSAKITAVLLTVMHRLRQAAPWKPSKLGALLPADSAVRTGRRSKCQITFPDGSFVRMGERTDLVITDLTGKRVRLRCGRLYVKIVSGTATVEGNTAVAAVKGSTFEFIGPDEVPAPGERPIETVRVWDGFVEFTCAGRTRTVGAGAEAVGQPDGTISQRSTPSQSYPGGSYENWFGGEWSGQTITTTPSSSAGTEQKMQLVTEQQVLTAPTRDEQRQEARQGAGLIEVTISSRQRGRSRRSSAPIPVVFATPGHSDRTRVAALPTIAFSAPAQAMVSQVPAGERVFERRFFGPTTGARPFAFVGGEQSVYGARVTSSSVYKDYYFLLATNLTHDFESSPDISLDEAFVSHRTRRQEWTLGRQRFLNGPVNNNELGTLHDFRRVTSVRWRGKIRKGPELDIAYIERAETYPGAAGEAIYARVADSIGPAVVGVNVLEMFDEGTGQSVDVAVSALPRRLDVYGEVGEDPTGRNLHTIGLYFPKLYQRAGVDLFVEQAKRQHFPSAFSIAAYKQITGGAAGVLVLQKESGANWSIGAGYAVQLGRK